MFKVGTIGGSLNYKQQHPEFPSDVFVLLDTIDAQLTILDSEKNQRIVNLTEFLAMDMNKKVLYNIILPRIETHGFIRTYRVAIRAQNAHAYVNAGFNVRLDDDSKVILARLCYGGINPKFSHAFKTESLLKGRHLYSNETLQEALRTLNDEIHPDWVLPDAHPEYRKKLAIAYFYRFILSTCPMEKLTQRNVSGATTIQRPLSSGTQYFKTIEQQWPLTQPVVKYEGIQQTSGEAIYINDLPHLDRELWAAFSVATRVNSIVMAINPTIALASAGARFFFQAKDIPGKNNFTPISINTTYDEQIFVPIGGTVLFHGQPVGVLLAETYEEAVLAAEKVEITYAIPHSNSLSWIMSIGRSLLNPFGAYSSILYMSLILSR